MAQRRTKKPPKPPRDAEATRARIIEAAKVRFSEASYDSVGVREIAADAEADPALVIRYFGSKEVLFREVAAQAFSTVGLLDGGVTELPERAAELSTGELDDRAWREGYDPLRLLLCSIGSTTAGPILSEYLDRDFLQPLAAALHSRERAAALAAQVVGIALIRIAAAGTKQKPLNRGELQQLLAAMLRVSVASRE